MPCLTIAFGDIPPGGFSVARWLMDSTLQGYFTDYSVMFEHVNSLNLMTLSEVDVVGTTSQIANADIFELDHVVKVDVPLDDGLPDFLINDPPGLAGIEVEYQGTVQRIHCSDGTIKPVDRINSASFDGPPSSRDLSVVMTVEVTVPGWQYIRVLDPGGSDYFPVAVERSSGSCGIPCAGSLISVGGPGDIVNAWRTSRWEDIDDPNPTLMTRLHVIDYVQAAGFYDYMISYSALLKVDDVVVNGGIANRSSTSSVQVDFSLNTNIPGLIASSDIRSAVSIWKRQGHGASKINLYTNRYKWDPVDLSLTIDLTVNGLSIETISILQEGNYELRLDTSLITTPIGGGQLQDDDGVVDGTWVFGNRATHAFYRLSGDEIGLDRQVSQADVNLVRLNFNTVIGDPGVNPNADMDGFGLVDFHDAELVNASFWNVLEF